MKHLAITLGLLMCTASISLNAQDSSFSPHSRLSLVFAGDVMGHDAQIESAKALGSGSYDYSSCFRYVSPYIKKADIAIANLEVTFGGSPYTGYPSFSSPDELAEELKNSGFDILVKANNHALDRKRAGLERTVKVLDSLGLIQSGVFEDPEQRRLEYPLIVEKNNIRLALLNYTYGTNGIRTSAPNIVNYIDTVQILKDLEKARSAKPDFIIALMHWGSEYQRIENDDQKKLAEWLFKNGTNTIIGSHPHVVQPIRKYPGGKMVVFSMGNMISNQSKRFTDGGIMVRINLEKSDSTRLVNLEYMPIWVHRAETNRGSAYQLVPAETDSIYWQSMGIKREDAKAMKLFLNDTRENLPGIKASSLHP